MTTTKLYRSGNIHSTIAGACIRKHRQSQRFSKSPDRLLIHYWGLVVVMATWHLAAAENANFESVTSVPGELQCPNYNRQSKNLYFCDKKAGTINQFNTDTKQLNSLKIVDGNSLSFIIPVGSSISDLENLFAIGVNGEVGIIQWDGVSTTNCTAVSSILVSPDGIIFGKANLNNVLFVSTSSGKLFSIRPDHSVELQPLGVGQIDGFDWNSEGPPYFFYVDKSKSTLILHKYDPENNKLVDDSNPTVFDFKANNISGVPRTVNFDTIGDLWVTFSTSNLIVQLEITLEPAPVIKVTNQLLLPEVGINYFTFGDSACYVTTSLSGKYARSGTLLQMENPYASGRLSDDEFTEINPTFGNHR